MAERAKLMVVMDDKGIHAEIKGNPADVMFVANIALKQTEKALRKCPGLTDEEILSLMDEVVESYQVEAHYGKEVADLRSMMQILMHS